MAWQQSDISVKTLVESGLLEPGASLEWKRKKWDDLTAEVTPEGNIRIASGQEFDTPTGAAQAAGGTVVNGWTVWRIAGTSTTLGDLRKALRTSTESQ